MSDRHGKEVKKTRTLPGLRMFASDVWEPGLMSENLTLMKCYYTSKAQRKSLCGKDIHLYKYTFFHVTVFLSASMSSISIGQQTVRTQTRFILASLRLTGLNAVSCSMLRIVTIIRAV